MNCRLNSSTGLYTVEAWLVVAGAGNYTCSAHQPGLPPSTITVTIITPQQISSKAGPATLVTGVLALLLLLAGCTTVTALLCARERRANCSWEPQPAPPFTVGRGTGLAPPPAWGRGTTPATPTRPGNRVLPRNTVTTRDSQIFPTDGLFIRPPDRSKQNILNHTEVTFNEIK